MVVTGNPDTGHADAVSLSLDLQDCVVSGAALTTAFLTDGLTRVLQRHALSPKRIDGGWDALHRSLRLLHNGGAQLVHQRATMKLASALGYGRPLRQDPVPTRDGLEDGGWRLQAGGETRLRAWSVPSDLDLDAPARSARANRCSPTRVAQRVLLASGERAGLVTNGDMLRLLLSDPSRADSHITIAIAGWRELTAPPDSYRLLLALIGAPTLHLLPTVLGAGRLHQAKLTSHLRRQARDAITGFINAVLERTSDRSDLDPTQLWREGLVLVYRLLFILKLEAPSDEGAGFSFASTRLWRTALSPNQALGPLVRRHLDQGVDTGKMLEAGLRTLFAIFRDGLSCSELHITSLGGRLFGTGTIPLLEQTEWGDRAVAILLDRLIWTTASGGERARVHYGSLDVEDLGSVYEALLEQEPGIATEPMIRKRHGRLETVAPRGADESDAAGDARSDVIETGRFFLRTGMGRKASGSFYTPHEFVRFLVHEALEPKVAALSPAHDPRPAALLRLKIVDPATGSGHFLVEACRYLGEALLTACRLCDELGLRERIAALPDADNTVALYLPSRSRDGSGGFSEMRARAICRRLVAVHCLYGCDRNKLAVELAKLSLWLESYAEGLPLTFLDHRLIHGDALSGPFFASLSILPVTGRPLDPLLARGVADRLAAALGRARRLVAELDASIGRDLPDLLLKEMAKERLDNVLHPLRHLARSWAGAVVTRERDADDVWLHLAGEVAETGQWPDVPTPRQAALLEAGVHAVAWDLEFPEIFPAGFSVVLGNPPWDVVQHNTKDFVAAIDPSVLTAATPAQRASMTRRVLAQPAVAAAFEAYRTGFERQKRLAARLYLHQRVNIVAGHSTAGNLDLFRLFAERAIQLVAADGTIGVLMPSAFHANEGTTGIRLLYFRETDVVWCLSFENRRRIFDIDSRFKFDLIVARLPGPTRSLRCAFYLEGIEQITDAPRVMIYTMPFLEASGGASLTPLELRGQTELKIAEQLFAHSLRLGAWCDAHGIRLGRDLHMTDDAGAFQQIAGGGIVLHEGKTFHQYTDRWDTAPRYSVAAEALRSGVADAARYYRLAFRDIARSNDERTMIAFVAPPGVVFGHTATVEKSPRSRSNADALVMCALFNSFTFDWLMRQKAATHLSLYLLETLPVPRLCEIARRFLVHGALRLSCNHAAFGTLWREQIGGDHDIEAPEARWSMRSRIDAVVAQAYGLDRRQYDHVLSSFSHRSCPTASESCLAEFDTLRAEGLDSFCRRRNPYRDVPLVTALATPADVATSASRSPALGVGTGRVRGGVRRLI